MRKITHLPLNQFMSLTQVGHRQPDHFPMEMIAMAAILALTVLATL